MPKAAIEQMTTDGVKAYMDSHKPDDFTLLDVRQDWEYEEFHLPGARLIPVTELSDRFDEVDKSKPVVAYCRSGGRSSAAAALLEGQGYHVINMVGGAMAWQGHTASGPIELGMVQFTGEETPEEIIRTAYSMEHTLQSFYVLRADMAETLERIELFMELASFEDKHKDVLVNLHNKLTGDSIDAAEYERLNYDKADGLGEGGISLQEFFDEHEEAFDPDQGILQLAVMIEAQALDYYLRCAMRVENQESADVLQLLARGEKAHLKLLGNYMDRRDEGI